MAKKLIYVQGLKEFEAYIKDLRRGGMTKLGNEASYHLAQKIQALVKARYRELASRQTRSGWPARATAVGKAKGRYNPERLPSPSGWSTLEELASIVEREMVGPGTHMIRVTPGKHLVYHYNRGPISHLMADWIENPKPMVIPKTFAAMIYRIMLQERGPGKVGYGTKKSNRFVADMPDMGVAVYTPPQRPVWKKVAADLMKPSLQVLYTKDLRAKMRAMTKAYGAK